MQRVHIVTPTRSHIRAELGQFREYLAARERRFEIVLSISDAQPVANNRNRIAKNFLADQAADWLLSIDSDSVPVCNPLDYIALDPDVLGFPYLTWRANDDAPLLWHPFEPNGERGIVEVEAVGGGCLLIARRVLEAVTSPFLDSWDQDGLRTVPEDTTFCHRARVAGFRVWCSQEHPLLHFKTIELYTLWRWIHDRKTDV